MNDSPPSIPGHELLRCIGRGSYGEVWLARDAAGGFRAVKIVYRKTFEHDRPFERELSGIQKFEPVSRSHPSQVSILQVGRNQAGGYFYYVMELADDASAESGRMRKWESEKAGTDSGKELPPAHFPTFSPATYAPRTLKSELTRLGRLSFRECLDISLALTTALDHLHQNGLIHRDIKPSNVIFVQGVPKLADIGLVTDAGATISFVGTEGFLPPEGPGTAQADLYSLGKVLYEISTGRDRMDFPELPTFVDDATEKEHLLELNQIFLKACQNDVRKRYQSARELFDDLTLLRSGKSLRRARALERRLAKARLGVAVVIALLVSAALANYFIQQQRVRRAEQEAAQKERETRAEQSVTAEMRHRLAGLYTANGEALAAEGDYFGALVWFTKALGDESSEPARADAHRQRIESLLRRCPAAPNLFIHEVAVNSVGFSSDGRLVITASDDGAAQVWDAETSERAGKPLNHSGEVIHAELTPDGERAGTLSKTGIAQLWSQLAGEPVATKLDHPAAVTRIIFGPSGRQLLTVAEDSSARLWETSSRRLRFTLKHGGRILDAVFSENGRLVATASTDGSARVWDSETGEPITPALLHSGPVTHIEFSPDNRRLVTVSGSEARAWSARGGEPAPFTLRHDATILSGSFSPDGQRILTAGEDRAARIWDAITGRLLAPPIRHTEAVHHAKFSPDGRFIATASGRRVQAWDTRTFSLLPPTLILNADVRDLQFSPAGDRLLTASADGTARALAVNQSAKATLPSLDASNPQDWIGRAQVWSGRQISADEQIVPVEITTLRLLWQTLKAKSPRGSEATDLLKWHQRIGEAREQERDWFGAGFHWGRALSLKPGEKQFEERRDRAARELAAQEVAASRRPELPQRISARSPNARAALLDLSTHYNAALTETWLPTNIVASGNDLSALPQGVQKFGGIEFDVRGLIQLSGGALENAGGRFPKQVDGIRVGRKCRKLHFLHGAAWTALSGTHVGSYVIRYASGESREVRILFGQNVREWWSVPPQPQLTGAAVAWEGGNAATRGLGMSLRLYQMTWVNLLPEVEIAGIDLKSSLEKPAPFVIAITVE